MTNRPTNITNATRSATVADILERVLDKGVVIAGDIKIKLVEIELLTIQIRLVVCSVERAMAMGMDWWRTDPHWSTLARLSRVEELVEGEAERRSVGSGSPHSVLTAARPMDPVERRLQAMESTLRRLEERLSAVPPAAPPGQAPSPAPTPAGPQATTPAPASPANPADPAPPQDPTAPRRE